VFDRGREAGRRRPMLLALVYGVFLVLVGITASALEAVASVHVSSATLAAVVSRDRSLIDLFVNDTLRASDLTADGPSQARADELEAKLAALTAKDAARGSRHRDGGRGGAPARGPGRGERAVRRVGAAAGLRERGDLRLSRACGIGHRSAHRRRGGGRRSQGQRRRRGPGGARRRRSRRHLRQLRCAARAGDRGRHKRPLHQAPFRGRCPLRGLPRGARRPRRRGPAHYSPRGAAA
jgi:hypothetical protein